MIRQGRWEDQITAVCMEVMVGRRTAVACSSHQAAALVIETVYGRTGVLGKAHIDPEKPDTAIVRFSPDPLELDD